MKKIPTIFEREFTGPREFHLTGKIAPGIENILYQATATVKIDGSCCAIIGGTFYKRFDAKPGRKIPKDAIQCCEPDPITGHWPHWVKVEDTKADQWFVQAYNNSDVNDGTYEAVGPHFQGNPYRLEKDILMPHGKEVIQVERTFDGIKKYLEDHIIEGIVFWFDEPVAKIKRKDFGYKWPV